MKRVRELVERHPRGARAAGKTLFLAGSILILGAIFARAGMAWPVPEGAAVFAVAALLVLAGVALIHWAEKAGKGRGGGRP